MSINNDNTKQVVIISGKGGTGKTTLTAAFAALAKNPVVADCDVDAADLYILLKPEIKQSFSYAGGKKAVIDPVSCTGCSACEMYCRFDAIHNFQVDPLACEGCGFCYRICPENAVELKEVLSGYYYESTYTGGDFLYASLQPGEGNSGKLIGEVKNRANSIAEHSKKEWYLVDGPPGIGCPVNASLTGADYVIIITEPTVSGLHDLERVVQVVNRFKIPAAVVINKYDLNLNMTKKIEAFASRINMQIAGKIPFDETVDKALIAGRNIIEFEESPAALEIFNIWNEVKQLKNQ
jgi:MinD superfamily P-loop ATPase